MSGNFEVVPCGTLQRLAAVEAEVRSMRRCFEATERQRDQYKAERDALKAENERLSWIVNAASWHRAQEEHNALRAERDALLAALENAVDCWQTEGLLTDGHVQAMLAAIAKVKGGGND